MKAGCGSVIGRRYEPNGKVVMNWPCCMPLRLTVTVRTMSFAIGVAQKLFRSNASCVVQSESGKQIFCRRLRLLIGCSAALMHQVLSAVLRQRKRSCASVCRHSHNVRRRSDAHLCPAECRDGCISAERAVEDDIVGRYHRLLVCCYQAVRSILRIRLVFRGRGVSSAVEEVLYAAQ